MGLPNLYLWGQITQLRSVFCPNHAILWANVLSQIYFLRQLFSLFKTVEAERISVDHVAHLKPSDGGSAATQCEILVWPRLMIHVFYILWSFYFFIYNLSN